MLYVTRYQTNELASDCIMALEQGNIVYLPEDGFKLEKQEQNLLNEQLLKKGTKNISYDSHKQTLKGLDKLEYQTSTQAMMHRFSKFATQLIDDMFPEYQKHRIIGRTSYRPAGIENRPSSKLKDDTKLHVDAFVATPVQGLRILRVFSNINPHQEPRVWHAGESFEQVMARFLPQTAPYRPMLAKLLQKLKITKSKRTAYDHYMLQIHDRMKLDNHYQQQVQKNRIDFPSDSTWVVFTDLVSHAALSGQFLLEQTFYLPVNAMHSPQKAPLSLLQASRPDVIMV
jgi:hypothetical protein